MITRTTPYDDLPEFLTPSETMAYLGLSRGTVYDLIGRNKIEHVRFGRMIRIRKSALRQEAASAELR